MTARSTRWEIALVALLLVVLMRGVVAAPTDRWQTHDRQGFAQGPGVRGQERLHARP